MSPGAIIGKGGSNIKSLQARSGARVAVNTSTGRAEVSGSAAAVAEALRLLQLQIDAHQATGARCGYAG
jgi:polyribonucleotide nucleotidyltransferase